MVALLLYKLYIVIVLPPDFHSRNSVEISGWWALVQSKEQWIQFLEEQGASYVLWGSLGDLQDPIDGGT